MQIRLTMNIHTYLYIRNFTYWKTFLDQNTYRNIFELKMLCIRWLRNNYVTVMLSRQDASKNISAEMQLCKKKNSQGKIHVGAVCFI